MHTLHAHTLTNITTIILVFHMKIHLVYSSLLCVLFTYSCRRYVKCYHYKSSDVNYFIFLFMIVSFLLLSIIYVISSLSKIFTIEHLFHIIFYVLGIRIGFCFKLLTYLFTNNAIIDCRNLVSIIFSRHEIWQ